MPIYEQTPIRLQATLSGSPPVAPLDVNTGTTPKFWRGSSVQIQVGIFDAFGAPVDLSNLAKLQLFLFKSSTDLVPLVTKEIAGGSLTALTSLGWANGTQQNATFALTPGDTDQGLGGATSAPFWIVLNGVTNAGNQVLYVAGPATIFLASNALPSSAMPTPSEFAVACTAGNYAVTPGSNLHLEVISVAGAARTSNVIVGQAGLSKGARVDVLVDASGAAVGITLQFFVASLSGANPFSFSTDGGTTRALFKFYFDGANLQPLEAVNPAY